MKIITFALCLFWSVNAFAAGKWYRADVRNWKCVIDDGGPSALVKELVNLKNHGKSFTYKATDVKVEHGKPVIVSITVDDGVQLSEARYYRSKDACKAELAAVKKSDDAEIDKYK